MGGTARADDREPRGEHAPGQPGAEPRWAFAGKDGIGAALGDSARPVWFTLSHGILTEVFYPEIDSPRIRSLGFRVASGSDFDSDEAADAEHRVEMSDAAIPSYHVVNTCRHGRYRIGKDVFAHPREPVVLQRVRFEALAGKLSDYRIHALLNPHLNDHDGGDTAWLDEFAGSRMLFAEGGGTALALACSSPWIDGSADFARDHDGRIELANPAKHYDRAGAGNVLLLGEMDLQACDGRFVLALGFGANPEEAARRALAGLGDDFEAARRDYAQGWRTWHDSVSPPAPPAAGGRDLTRVSCTVLKTHQAKTVPGAMVASLSTPWGEARSAVPSEDTGGYHMVWPRDLCESAGGLLAAGAFEDAGLPLQYLANTQREDGRWPQNMRVGGEATQDGNQLGETAIPALFLDHLRREGAIGPEVVDQYWPMIRRAAAYVVRNGAATQEDRWENQGGYTPFTLALAIPSLLIAADMADEHEEAEAAAYLRETADAWFAAIDDWLYVAGTDLAKKVGVEGYYARIIPRRDEAGKPVSEGGNDTDVTTSESLGLAPEEVASPDALALVRFGLRAADDFRILDTVRVIDAVLRVETPSGPSWRRYTGDGYGEHSDGAPFDGKSRGIGRCWPLLTGERGHFELAAGREGEAVRMLAAMGAFANDCGMLPEQIWDAADIPERGLFCGHPAGSAMPLAWAHAEYLKLARSIREGQIFDMPPQAKQRYLDRWTGSGKAIWRFTSARPVIAEGKTLRIETLASALVRWTADDWTTQQDLATRDTMLGVHVADLPTSGLPAGAEVEFTFHWDEADRWEGRDFRVDVVFDAPRQVTPNAKREP